MCKTGASWNSPHWCSSFCNSLPGLARHGTSCHQLLCLGPFQTTGYHTVLLAGTNSTVPENNLLFKTQSSWTPTVWKIMFQIMWHTNLDYQLKLHRINSTSIFPIYRKPLKILRNISIYQKPYLRNFIYNMGWYHIHLILHCNTSKSYASNLSGKHIMTTQYFFMNTNFHSLSPLSQKPLTPCTKNTRSLET